MSQNHMDFIKCPNIPEFDTSFFFHHFNRKFVIQNFMRYDRPEATDILCLGILLIQIFEEYNMRLIEDVVGYIQDYVEIVIRCLRSVRNFGLRGRPYYIKKYECICFSLALRRQYIHFLTLNTLLVC